MPSVLITGSSSGIGLAAAVEMARRGWTTVASMRDPARGDRLRLRGSKRQLCNPGGAASFLRYVGVSLKDYKSYAKDTTVALCKSIETKAKQAGLYLYLNNCQESKEEVALRMAAESLCRDKSYLGQFYRRMKMQLNGAPEAITAAVELPQVRLVPAQ
jgi:NAD(P)-dependent dehydrogenase (short-subunit alcohol dehydrogenase family)